MEGCKYNIYVKGDEPEKLEPMDILISDRRELEVLRLCLGERVNFVMGNPKKNTTFRIRGSRQRCKKGACGRAGYKGRTFHHYKGMGAGCKKRRNGI